ncbi:MAG TPA: class I SAM-dependent methyltransferase [Bacteroidales bacterium]|nr:class I SAM-dependent methyltransferase [Bacteroidales bacterium]
MQSEHVNLCAVCHSDKISHYLECKDHFVSGESFHIASCEACGFCFTSARPLENGIAAYYESDDYVSHSKNDTGLINRLFHLSRIYTLWHKKRLVNKYAQGKNILDYGCGTGDFLATMIASGWNCLGVEPNEKARQIASSKSKLTVSDESGLSKLSDGSLQAITLWHVLEHIYPLEERLESFSRLLDEKGTLFVAVPNMLSFDAKIYGEHWAAWDVPRHIYHFTPDSITRLMKQFGFELVKSKGMLLDAFYISLLSEKYKNGKSNFPKAMLNGVRSNVSAFLGKGHYSSLIYIFKKSE